MNSTSCRRPARYTELIPRDQAGLREQLSRLAVEADANRSAGRSALSLFVARHRRVLWGLSYPVLTLLGYVGLFGPSNRVWNGGYVQSFMNVSIGDHVQMTYYLWLWWHALTTFSHLPWLDAFQFAATRHVTYFTFGWPLVLVSIPVQAMFGPIAAYNAVFYLGFVAAATATYLWVRQLGLPPPAAAVAGFAFAFAPFRLSQLSHANSILSFLLPLSLYAAERALRGHERHARWAAWGCVACFVSLTASSEMHLVFFFAPVLALYILVRARSVPRERLARFVLPLVVLILGSALFLFFTYWLTFRPSMRAETGVGDRAARYAPELADIVRKTSPAERTAYPGAVIALVATIGAVLGYRRRTDRQMVALLIELTVAAYVLALLPGLGTTGLRLFRSIPVLALIDNPGRVVVVVALALAALAAFALRGLGDQRRGTQAVVAGLLMAAILMDSDYRARAVDAGPADPNLMPSVPAGASVLELPSYPGNHAAASRYQLQLTYTPGPRVGGYSALVTPEAYKVQRRTWALNDVPPDPCRWLDVSRSIKFDYVAVHAALFGKGKLLHPGDGPGLIRAFSGMAGFERTTTVKDVVVFRFKRDELRCQR